MPAEVIAPGIAVCYTVLENESTRKFRPQLQGRNIECSTGITVAKTQEEQIKVKQKEECQRIFEVV